MEEDGFDIHYMVDMANQNITFGEYFYFSFVGHHKYNIFFRPKTTQHYDLYTKLEKSKISQINTNLLWEQKNLIW